MDLARCRQTLESAGVVFAAGLSATEIAAAERSYRFRFPPDLAAFLAHALPVSGGFVDWRKLDDPAIHDALGWPLEGLCYDIEHNKFWPEAWGERPTALLDAFDVARRRLAAAPTLIPILGHRYIPDRPSEAGNPVFSVYQTDIIHYGSDLENYLQNEFHVAFGTPTHSVPQPPREIEFWSWLVDQNC